MPNKTISHFAYRLGLPTHIYRQVDYPLKTPSDNEDPKYVYQRVFKGILSILKDIHSQILNFVESKV